MQNTIKKWTEQEIQILKENYVYGNIKNIISLLPDRSYGSITSKAEKIGLKCRDYWSNDEINILVSNYSTTPMVTMLTLLPNRNRRTIAMKALELGLRNCCKYQAWQEEYIKNHYLTMTDPEIAEVIGKTSSSVLDKRLLMGLHKPHTESSYNDIYEYLRRNNTDLKIKSMKNCNYKCVVTGQRFDEIHHLYSFNLIVKSVIEDLNFDIKRDINDYSPEQLKNILSTFREYQDKYPLGVCVTTEIHTEFHKQYGYGNTTEEQWLNFTAKYKN